jgi:hypothetical protein
VRRLLPRQGPLNGRADVDHRRFEHATGKRPACLRNTLEPELLGTVSELLGVAVLGSFDRCASSVPIDSTRLHLAGPRPCPSLATCIRPVAGIESTSSLTVDCFSFMRECKSEVLADDVMCISLCAPRGHWQYFPSECDEHLEVLAFQVPPSLIVPAYQYTGSNLG